MINSKFSKNILIIIFLGFFSIINVSLAASTCDQVHQGYGQCAPDCTVLGSDYLTDKTANLCPSGKCCYKTGGGVNNPSPLDSIALQIPLFDLINVNNIGQYILTIYRYIVIVLVPLAIIMIIVGGVVWITAAGEQSRIQNAKKYIISAFSGLVIGLFSFVLLSLVGINALIVPGLEEIQRLDGEALRQYELASTSGPGGVSSGGVGGKNATEITKNICQKTDLVNAYKSATQGASFDWRILAAIHFRECNNDPSCARYGGNPFAFDKASGPYRNRPECYNWPKATQCAVEFISKFGTTDPLTIFSKYNRGPSSGPKEYFYTTNDPDNGVFYMIRGTIDGVRVKEKREERPGALIIYNNLKQNCP